MVIVSLLMGLIAIGSIVKLNNKLHPIEVLTYWGFITPIEQISYILLAENLKYVAVHQNLSIYLALRVTVIITVPIAMVWFLVFVRSKAIPVIYKFVIFGAFILAFVGKDYLLVILGVLTFIHWSWFHSIILYAGMLILEVLFMLGFRFFLKKEAARV